MEDFKKRRNFGGSRRPFRGHGSEDRHEHRSEHRSEYKPDHRSEHKSEYRSERKSEFKSDYKSDFKSDYKSERKPRRSFGKPFGKPFGNSEERGEHRSFRHGDKPVGRKPFGSASKKKENGIDRMISRKPLISRMTRTEPVEVMAKDEVRLNKFIANSGVCSRREADVMIQAGVVSVNGEVVTELGTKVNIFKDEVRFNGELLRGENKVYIVMNKPKGYVTTASDPHAEKTVMDLLKSCEYRVFPVGRLDKNTTGVLMLTNDGDIAEKLTHPSYDKKKIYQATLDRELSREDFENILSGVELSDGLIAADELEYVDNENHKKIGIEIHSGKNRIVRRIFEHFGYDVKSLDRVYFAGLTKKGLKRGEWRFLTENEANILKMGAYI